MTFLVQMKDPDVLIDAIDEAVKRAVAEMTDIDADEREAVAEMRKQKVLDLCARWFAYGEYLGVEIDTDAETCTVVPVKER